ncbi:MAG: YifB family Mg chelatase-like AAA ATPase [Bacteroidales bacterium]|nr:YifB family Mg chelatase-like AAA ATPase [Bacteroidales bacterium]
MLCKVYCACCNGLEVTTITVEVSVSVGIQYRLVGLPDSAIKESQQRIDSALTCNGYRLPGKKLTINLAPANIRKEGSSFDVPLAIGILCASKQLEENITERLSSFIILGELALDGTLREIPGALPIIIHSMNQGFSSCILPRNSALEGAEIDGITIYGASTFKDVVDILSSPESCKNMIVSSKNISMQKSSSQEKNNYDFALVKGQLKAKRGLEIAAAGSHNVILTGSPGSGKTFMAKCLPGILPPMSKEEAIETSKIYSVAGLLQMMTNNENHTGGLIRQRPFRAPHHTITVPALIGGGNKGMPGEISLAHNGVLFADEFAEFDRRSIEVLRQPLEDGVVQVSRVRSKNYYPARFMLVAAMNPCPCGHLFDGAGECKCSSSAISKYRAKISGPVYDRIDINLIVRQVAASDLIFGGDVKEEPSSVIAERVKAARDIQLKRYSSNNESFFTNAAISSSGLKRYCSLGKREELFMEAVINRHKISARGYTRILKIARTIADLAHSDSITMNHLAEAVQFRCPDKDELF